MVEGYALAGGFEAALACDLIVAGRTAQFGLPEAKRGLAAAAGGLLRLTRLIPERIAMEMTLTGDRVSAELGSARMLRDAAPSSVTGRPSEKIGSCQTPFGACITIHPKCES